jgi:hypothetical protein
MRYPATRGMTVSVPSASQAVNVATDGVDDDAGTVANVQPSVG